MDAADGAARADLPVHLTLLYVEQKTIALGRAGRVPRATAIRLIRCIRRIRVEPLNLDGSPMDARPTVNTERVQSEISNLYSHV